MKGKLPYIALFLFYALIQVVGNIQPQLMPFLNVIFFGTLIQVMYLSERAAEKNAEAQRIALAEAGTAITDTLKVAFENLKKVASTGSKVQQKLSDHDTRIHRLERSTETKRVDSRIEAIKAASRVDSKLGARRAQPTEPLIDDDDLAS